jgi:hypothetical protein
MDVRKTALEKAFELARSGKCRTVTDIVKRFKSEGYDESQIAGPALRKQLLQLIKEPRRAR